MLPEDFSRTGLHVSRRNGPPPARFQVLGERSTGTNLVKRLVARNTGLHPTEALGWKHGFCQVLAVPVDFLVVCVVRNARDWSLSMHAKPWHASKDLQSLAYSDFVRSPWETEIDDRRFFPDAEKTGVVGQPLQPDRDPMLGTVFPNLFALRRAKLMALTGWILRHNCVVLVRMEEVTERPEAFLDVVEAHFALPARAAYKPVLKRLGSRFTPRVEARPATPPFVGTEDIAFMKTQLDLSLEAGLGYLY